MHASNSKKFCCYNVALSLNRTVIIFLCTYKILQFDNNKAQFIVGSDMVRIKIVMADVVNERGFL